MARYTKERLVRGLGYLAGGLDINADGLRVEAKRIRSLMTEISESDMDAEAAEAVVDEWLPHEWPFSFILLKLDWDDIERALEAERD